MTTEDREDRGRSRDAYRDMRDAFAWEVPARYNIGIDVCDKWANVDPDRTAIIELDGSTLRRTSFDELKRHSNRLANLLVSKGLKVGDRVAVLAPQRLETAVAHIAIYKAGAIAVPLFTLFGPDALHHRLQDSGTRFVIADDEGVRKLRSLSGDLPQLEQLIAIDPAAGAPSLLDRLQQEGDEFDVVDTSADDPAMIIYTSGTTGASKGALHAHRVLLGHLPGVEMSHDGFPQVDDCIWTPADWAWIGGLLDVLLPALHHGVPVIAHRFEKFDAEATFDLLARCRIRNTFLPPTALKLMRTVACPDKRWPFSLRSVASGGESLGGELLKWGRETLGVEINEFYGQTECNMIVSSRSDWFDPRPGAIGKTVPGHTIAIIDEQGVPVAAGEDGEIAVLRPDPVMFLGYWNLPEATSAKFVGDWLRTGDMATMDEEGFIRFFGRSDDVITSGGYRIGPGEIEDCLLRHPAVQSAGVVGVPDALRTELVVAFVVPQQAARPSPELAAELQHHVRSQLGGHQYPRRVIFTEALPTTPTGKVLRRDLRRMASETREEHPGNAPALSKFEDDS